MRLVLGGVLVLAAKVVVVDGLVSEGLHQMPLGQQQQKIGHKLKTDEEYRSALDLAYDHLARLSDSAKTSFEQTMRDLLDKGDHLISTLTWDWPSKKTVPRSEDTWAHHVTLAALPEHGLRIKPVDPSKLGVDKVKQYSGYLDVNEGKHFFFWFFESRNAPKTDDIVLWLSGGPGCSSMVASFFELGPSSVSKDGKRPVHNPYSWNSNASVIFLDQPINVGYSYGRDSVSSTTAAGKDVYAFLSLFFKQFPEYAKLNFHIAGESYAGRYIPQFAKEIIEHQSPKSEFSLTARDAEVLPKINLKTVLIGNGLTDPLVQYKYYSQMACNNSYKPVLSDEQCQAMDDAYPRCASLIESCYESENVFSCVPASLYCNNAMMGPYSREGLNPYDVRKKCEDQGNLCYPQLGVVETFLNRAEVMDAIGAEVDSFQTCNTGINQNFLFNGDWMKPYQRAVPVLLEHEIPVLIYAGDMDFICNWMGNEAWTLAMEWPGQKAFNAAKVEKFRMQDSGKHVGDVRNAGNLTFLRVFGGWPYGAD